MSDLPYVIVAREPSKPMLIAAVEWWKPRDRRRNLVRAAALIVAEIERIDRSSRMEGKP